MDKAPRKHNQAHLAFVRTLPCASCLHPAPCEAAHLRAGDLEWDKRETGKGEKPSDKWTTPLCTRCHAEQHGGNELEFWARRGINPFKLCTVIHRHTGDYARCNSEIIQAQLMGACTAMD